MIEVALPEASHQHPEGGCVYEVLGDQALHREEQQHNHNCLGGQAQAMLKLQCFSRYEAPATCKWLKAIPSSDVLMLGARALLLVGAGLRSGGHEERAASCASEAQAAHPGGNTGEEEKNPPTC